MPPLRQAPGPQQLDPHQHAALRRRRPRTVSLPAAERTHVAVEWQAAAAAWRAAFEQLEYARQADPEAAVVQQSEQSICDMRGFKRQCQQW